MKRLKSADVLEINGTFEFMPLFRKETGYISFEPLGVVYGIYYRII